MYTLRYIPVFNILSIVSGETGRHKKEKPTKKF